MREEQPKGSICAVDRLFSEAEVGEMAGVTSRLPRLPPQSKITSPGRDTEGRQQKWCPEKESEQL